MIVDEKPFCCTYFFQSCSMLHADALVPAKSNTMNDTWKFDSLDGVVSTWWYETTLQQCCLCLWLSAIQFRLIDVFTTIPFHHCYVTWKHGVIGRKDWNIGNYIGHGLRSEIWETTDAIFSSRCFHNFTIAMMRWKIYSKEDADANRGATPITTLLCLWTILFLNTKHSSDNYYIHFKARWDHLRKNFN